MTAGILSSIPRDNLIFKPRTVNGQLRSGERCIATGMVTQLDLPSPLGSAPIEVLNDTGTDILIAATNGATILGNNVTTGTAFLGVSSVRLPVRGRAVLSADGSNWSAVGCTGPLVFSYNGTPLSNNSGNPSEAGGVIHFLGGVGGFINPATNGALQSTQSGSAGANATVLSDRVASPTNIDLVWQAPNVANSWVAWQFPTRLSPTGFLIQNNGIANFYHVRSFELRYSNDTSAALSSSSPVASWTQGPSWVNQTQITGASAWHFFEGLSLPFARRWAIRMTGLDSEGTNQQRLAEVEWFGICEG